VNALERAERDAAIEAAERALASAATPEAIAALRWTLLRAHAARAEDARHGANQLSLGAQRAPTTADCDDGWQRVEEIVTVAESSAASAALLAPLLDTPTAHKLARAARSAAHSARRLVDERNHAYTFHADPRFSFGEGWYLAAAAALAGVTIQIEPSKLQTAQASHFLESAGLASLVRPYRPRPRANKHLPEIVARAFRADPLAAQRNLRAAFLGTEPVPQPIADWIDARVSSSRPTLLLWVRHGSHHPTRNTTQTELLSLTHLALASGLAPILVGDALRDGAIPDAIDLTLFWQDPLFQGLDMRRAQLHFFEHLRAAHRLVGQLGVTTAGMDGPALLGLPTMYLTAAPNPRLGTWVGAIPGYTEVVRAPDYLDRVAAILQRWC